MINFYDKEQSVVLDMTSHKCLEELGTTITVQDLINWLSMFKGDTPVVLRNQREQRYCEIKMENLAWYIKGEDE